MAKWIAWLVLAGWLVAPQVRAEVMLGSDVLAQMNFAPLKGKRVGLLTNPSGINRRGNSMIDELRKAKGVQLVALFAAEHGIYGTIPAGREFTSSIDARTRLPIYSLYGPGPIRRPTPAMLQGIDTLVYDIQDTGIRSYTYISTMGLAMEACGAANVEFMVLDRPNPLGGLRAEGPMLDNNFRSFVGQWSVPYIYGLTCGELARMINGEGWITNRCRLSVIPMTGWQRSMVWNRTGLKWTPTSPNVPNGETPMYLASTGILGELGGLNLGGGTPYRFQCFSAPWLNASTTSKTLNNYRLPGVAFRPMRYQKSSGEWVQGVKIDITNASQSPLMCLNLHIWDAIKRTSGRDLFQEAQKSGHSFNMFDKVIGTDQVRRSMERGQSSAFIVATWKNGESQFRARRQKYLIPSYGQNVMATHSKTQTPTPKKNLKTTSR
jgi:uncharacterized protein YbbC (DUF1343 family)